jgi:hypothetical protein
LRQRFLKVFRSVQTQREEAAALASSIDELLDDLRQGREECAPIEEAGNRAQLTSETLLDAMPARADAEVRGGQGGWLAAFEGYIAKLKKQGDHWLNRMTPTWKEREAPLSIFAALRVGLGGTAEDLAAMEFDCQLGDTPSFLLADSGSQLTIMRTETAAALGLKTAGLEEGSILFDCLDAQGNSLPFGGQLAEKVNFSMKDAKGEAHSMTIDPASGRWSDKILLVDTLPVPFLLGRPAMATLDWKLGMKEVSIACGDHLFLGRRPGDRPKTVASPISLRSSGQGRKESLPVPLGSSGPNVEASSAGMDTAEDVYPLHDVWIGPNESAKVRLSVARRGSNLRFFVADLDLADRELFGCSDGPLPDGDFPWVLVTNESVAPLTISALQPLGQLHTLRAQRVFVVQRDRQERSPSRDHNEDGHRPTSKSGTQALSAFPLPAPDVDQQTAALVPLRWDDEHNLGSVPSGVVASDVHPLRDFTIPARGRDKVLLWLPPDKEMARRTLFLSSEVWASTGLSVDVGASSPLKADHPIPVLWVENDTDQAIVLKAELAIGRVYSEVREPLKTLATVIRDRETALQRNGCFSLEEQAFWKRGLTVAAVWDKAKDSEWTEGDEPPEVGMANGFSVIDPGDAEKNLLCSDDKLREMVASNVPEERRAGFLKLLEFYRDTFTNSFSGPPWDIEQFDIPLQPGVVPIKSRGYRFCHAHMEALRLLLEKWVAEGICSRSTSPWASPAFFRPQTQWEGVAIRS